jgi:putative ABC transport system substrate-binding protein
MRCGMKRAAVPPILIAVVLLALGVTAEAQQPKKVPRIGYLSSGNPASESARSEGIRLALRERGYIEGQNITTEYRYADGKPSRQSELAAELVRLKVNLIVSASPPVTSAAKDATVTLPIVMAEDPHPVGNGFVASLARPGGNITGLASLTPEVSGNRLELLTEIIPRLASVAVLGYLTEPGYAQVLREIELAAGAFKVQFQYLDVLDPKDIEDSFRAATKGRADAILLMNSPVFIAYRKQVAHLAVKNRPPAIYYSTEFVEDGGLMSYGVSFTDLYRRTATYVDKILKGRNPADLPVEQPTKFEFIINLKTAKQIGLTIPPNVVVRADKVIK